MGCIDTGRGRLMRIALNLDEDVAALIENVRKATSASLKEVVNAALREGLARMLQSTTPRKNFRTGVHPPGRCYLPNLDNTADVLAFAEGESLYPAWLIRSNHAKSVASFGACSWINGTPLG